MCLGMRTSERLSRPTLSKSCVVILGPRVTHDTLKNHSPVPLARTPLRPRRPPSGYLADATRAAFGPLGLSKSTVARDFVAAKRYVYMHVCIYIYIYREREIHIHVHIYRYIYIYIHICVYIYIYIYLFIYLFIHTCKIS